MGFFCHFWTILSKSGKSIFLTVTHYLFFSERVLGRNGEVPAVWVQQMRLETMEKGAT